MLNYRIRFIGAVAVGTISYDTNACYDWSSLHGPKGVLHLLSVRPMSDELLRFRPTQTRLISG